MLAIQITFTRDWTNFDTDSVRTEPNYIFAVVFRTSIIRVSLFDSPSIIPLSSSFQVPTVQISPEKDLFRCSDRFIKFESDPVKCETEFFFVTNSSG